MRTCVNITLPFLMGRETSNLTFYKDRKVELKLNYPIFYTIHIILYIYFYLNGYILLIIKQFYSTGNLKYNYLIKSGFYIISF